MMNKFDKFCYKFIKFGIFISAFTPLIIFRNSFSPFNFGKAIVFRILIEVLLLVYIPMAIKYRGIRPQIKNPIFIFLALFTISMAVSVFAGVNWHQSFWGYWERMGGLFSWLHFYALFILAVSVIKTRDDFINLIWFSVIAAFISSIFGFFQKFSASWVLGADSRVRIFGTLGNPAAFTSYLIFNLYFVLFLFKEFSRRKLKVFLGIAVVIFITAIFMAGVRGTFVGLVFGLIAYLFLEWPNIKKLLNKKVVPLLFIVLLASSYFIWSNGYIQDKLFSTHTIIQRFTVWKTAFSGIKERPLLGWGPENFSVAFSKFYDSRIKDELVFDRAHNFLLDIAVTQGLIGLSIWLFLWFYLARIFFIKNKLFSSLIIAHLVNLFFFFDLFSTYLMTMFLLLAPLVDNVHQPPAKGVIYWWRRYVAVIVLITVTTALIYWANIKPALANFYSTRGYALLAQKRDSEGLDYFQKAFKNADWSAQDIYKKFAESYLDYIFTIKKPDESHRVLLDDLIKQLESEIKNYDTDYSLYIYLHKSYRAEARLFDSESKYKSKKLLGDAIDKFPMVLPLYYELFNYLVEMEELREAEVVMGRAYELYKDLPQSRFRLGLIYILNGVSEKNNFKKADGLGLLTESINEDFVLYDEMNYLARFFEKNKLYDDMITIFQALKDKRPEYNIHLSYVYLLKNDRANAVKYADLALALSYDQIGSKGFRLLSEIYKKLGDNNKRSEALLKSAP